MSLHRARVRAQLPNLQIVMPNERFEYNGEPTWQFEPIDQGERTAWREAVTDPVYAESEIGLCEDAAMVARMVPDSPTDDNRHLMSGQAPQGYIRGDQSDPLMAGQAPQKVGI